MSFKINFRLEYKDHFFWSMNGNKNFNENGTKGSYTCTRTGNKNGIE